MQLGTRLFTVRDLTVLLSVCDETVYRWIRAGKLKAKRVGREWRFDNEAINAFINSTSPEDRKD